jgi:hypothetical protein
LGSGFAATAMATAQGAAAAGLAGQRVLQLQVLLERLGHWVSGRQVVQRPSGFLAQPVGRKAHGHQQFVGLRGQLPQPSAAGCGGHI